MKILIVTGSYPPDVCGVGDYTANLVVELSNYAEIKVEKFNNCTLKGFIELVKKIKRFHPDVIHIQYPTEGYGYSIYPQLLSVLFRRKVVVTIHEFSSKSLSGKIAIYLFFIFADKLVFTTQGEYLFALKRAPFIKRKSQVINIGSNIPFLKPSSVKHFDVVYFGHIRPLKGVEIFLELVNRARQENKSFKFLIIGQALPNYLPFFNEVQSKAKVLNIEMKINIASYEVAQLLNESKFAYLPYPDGVTRRRGSFHAALGNGCIVITTKGSSTLDEFNNLCLFANNHNEAYSLLLNQHFENLIDEKIINFISNHSWKTIVNGHMDIYNLLKDGKNID